MSKNGSLITHHIFPANIHENGGKKGEETVDMYPKLEKFLHQNFINMSPGKIFVFFKIIFFDQRKKKWTSRRLSRLRKAIIAGDMSPQNVLLADLVNNNKFSLLIMAAEINSNH